MVVQASRDMEEIKQSVVFDNEGLKVYTDNGCISKDSTTSVIKGRFAISAGSVAKLIAFFTDNTVVGKGEIDWFTHTFDLWKVITRDEAIEALTAKIESREEQRYKILADKYDAMREEAMKMREAIREHNAKCGLFHKSIIVK